MPTDPPPSRRPLEPSESLDPFESERTERWPDEERTFSAAEYLVVAFVLVVAIIAIVR